MSSFIPAIATRRHPAPRASRATKKTKQSFLHNHLVSPSCDPGGARTHDPLIKNQLLCQLSYGVNGAFISELRLQRYDFFFELPTLFPFFFKKIFIFLFWRAASPPNEHFNGQSSQAGRRGAENGRFLCPVSKNKQHVALIFRKNLIFASKQWQGAWSAPGRRGPPPSRKANLQCKFRQKH